MPAASPRLCELGPFQVKTVDPERRQLTGLATTPRADRAGDIIEPLGATFTNPLPLLLDHDTRQPIGHARFSRPTAEGIEYEATIPTIAEPGRLKDLVDEAWQSVKAGLRSGVSIGFRVLEETYLPETRSYRYLKTEVLELSLVTIPANPEATVARIKALDLAATGRSLPGVPGAFPVVRADKAAPPMSVYAEQIRNFETRRAANIAAMHGLMEAAAERNETLTAEETAQYDKLTGENTAIDEHLPRLRATEKAEALSATRVAATSPAEGSATRAAVPVITVKSRVAPGTAFTRYTMAIAACQGNKHEAAEYARQRWHDSTPEVELALKAAVAAGTTTDATWAGPLAVMQPLASEFLELLRPQTFLGKIQNFRRVPFNISVPQQTAGGTYQWVGQGAPKPIGKLAFATVTLGIAKAAGIIVLTDELVRNSNPSAEDTVRKDMVAGMATYLDQQFIDPALAAVANVSPGSVTNGTTPITTAGTTPDNARTDLKALVASFVTANLSTASATFVMSESNAFALGAALNPLGQALFPGVGTAGGSVFGIPVVTSQSAGTTVALIDARGILLADEGGLSIDVSREATLQMDSAPDNPPLATTVFVSMFQSNMLALRAERFINWKRAQTASVKYVVATYA